MKTILYYSNLIRILRAVFCILWTEETQILTIIMGVSSNDIIHRFYS